METAAPAVPASARVFRSTVVPLGTVSVRSRADLREVERAELAMLDVLRSVPATPGGGIKHSGRLNDTEYRFLPLVELGELASCDPVSPKIDGR